MGGFEVVQRLGQYALVAPLLLEGGRGYVKTIRAETLCCTEVPTRSSGAAGRGGTRSASNTGTAQLTRRGA